MKIFLEDSEMVTLTSLAERAQDLAHQARLARLSVDAFIRLAAARNRLDPEKEYRVTPRGEIVEIPPSAPDHMPPDQRDQIQTG